MVMILAISSSIVVIQSSLRSIDTARDTTIAAQILQTLTEDLRTRTWAQVTNTTITPVLTNQALAAFDRDQINHYQSLSFTSAGSRAASVLNRFKFSRTIEDVAGNIVAGVTTMKKITLIATWTGIDGRKHSVSTTSYYAQYGLYAYYST